MLIYNLIENSGNYSNTLGSLWHNYRDEPFLADPGAIGDFTGVNK